MELISHTGRVVLLTMVVGMAMSVVPPQAAPPAAPPTAPAPIAAATVAPRTSTPDLVTLRLVRAINRRQPVRALRFATRPVVRKLMSARRDGYRFGGLRANPCGRYGSPTGWDCPATVFRGSQTIGTAYLWGSYRDGRFKIRRATVALGE